MYNWIYFQYCYLFFSLFMVIVIYCIYSSMNRKAKNMKVQRAQSEVQPVKVAIN